MPRTSRTLLETLEDWRKYAGEEYDRDLKEKKKGTERRRAKMSSLTVWIIFMVALVIIDVAVYNVLFLELDMPPATAVALTLLMALLLQGLPALTAFCAEAITSRWGDYRHSRGAAGLVVIMIIIGIAGTGVGLWVVTVMRLNLYEYGNDFYGQATNLFALLAPFLTSFFALLATFIFFPAGNIVDLIVKRATPAEIVNLMDELEELKRDAYVYEHGDIAYLQSQRDKLLTTLGTEESALTSAKLRAWAACQPNGDMPNDINEFQVACVRSIHERRESERGSLCVAFLDKLRKFNGQISTFINLCISSASTHVSQNHYPYYVGESISAISAGDIINTYNTTPGRAVRDEWNTQESFTEHGNDFYRRVN